MKQGMSRAFAFTCGLLTSGILAAPAYANDLVPPKILTRTPGGVNISDGAFVETVTDIQIGTLALERFHMGVPQAPTGFSGRDPDDPFFGRHVSHNFDIYVAKNLTQAHDGYPQEYMPIVHMGMATSGMYEQDRASPNATIYPANDEAMKGVMVQVNGDYNYTDETGVVYQFDHNIPAIGAGAGAQRVSSITYPTGRLVTFGYSSSGQLKIVRDNQGFAIVFDYASNGNVSAACGYNAAVTAVSASSTCTGAALKTTYAYTGDLLTGVTDVTGGTTTYTYTTNHLCITPPGYSTCKIDNMYNGFYEQVVQQTMADGSVWSLALAIPHSRDPEIYVDGTHTTRVTDPSGHYTDYEFTGSTLNRVTDSNGHVTAYTFVGSVNYHDPFPEPNQGNILAEVVYQEGNRYVSANNGPYLTPGDETWYAKPSSGTTNVTVSRGYGSCLTLSPSCFWPIWTRDGNGNQTDITYNSVGQVLTETGPAVNGMRPQTRYEYTGRAAWISDGAGAFTPAGAPISVRVASSTCRTSAATGNPAAPCATAGDEVRTTYDYGPDSGPNNLFLRGQAITADGVTLRTCWGYDSSGRRISETGTGAQPTQCP
jgi:hypothetical protein